MGLLDKRNPSATLRSVTGWAVGGAVVGSLVGLFGWFRSELPTTALFFILPWMALFCGIAGGAFEWQDSEDD